MSATATAPLSCGCESHREGHTEFFVSVRKGDHYVVLAGPWPTHEEALANVERFRRRARDVDPRACWYAYGTCSAPPGEITRTVFDRDSGEVLP